MVSCYVICGADKKMVLRASPRSMGRGGEEFEKERGGKGEGAGADIRIL